MPAGAVRGVFVVAVLTAALLARPEPAATQTPAETPQGAGEAGAGPAAADSGGADAPAGDTGETIVVGPEEAYACAARLEPMAASFEEPREAIYLQRVADAAFRVWAPRESGPAAPLVPWCVTTLDSIAEISFVNTANRAVVMELVAGAQTDPPAPRAGPEEADPVPAPAIVVEDEEDRERRGLPAAYQRTPPKGGRSAARLGVPVPAAAGLAPAARATIEACTAAGGQATAVFDRQTSRLLAAECRRPDGSTEPLPALAADLGADRPGG